MSTMTDKNESEAQLVVKSKYSRRPDVDIIRIILTWGILLFHTVAIYIPKNHYYVKIIPEYPPPQWHLMGIWFNASMHAWNMPMFFFLSGISAFFGLKKRSEKEFRMERVHRLLAPALFLSLFGSFGVSTDFVSKLSPNCEEYYNTGEVSE